MSQWNEFWKLADFLQYIHLQMAYHLNTSPRFIGYQGSKKEGGWGDWSLARIVKKPRAVCKKCSDSCLRVVIDDFGNIDLGACMWCKARSVGCSTVQRRCRSGVSKAKAKGDEEPKGGKRKASEVGSEGSEDKEPLAKKVKSHSVIEDSKAHAPDGEVVENGVIDKHAGASVVNMPETRAYERGGLMGTDEAKEASTHQVLSLVVVLYICAERRQPIARYCSSAEKRTDPTLLEGAGLVWNR
jgi:hypothetical protein